MEETRGRRYKEGDQMVQRGIFGRASRRGEFLQKKRVRKVMEQEGKKTRGGG